MKRLGECVMCGGCCESLRITSVLSNLISQHGSLDEARAYYSFRGIEISYVNKETDTVCLELNIPCDKLTADKKCLLNDQPEQRPLICHRYPWFQDDIETCGYSWK